SLHYKEKNKLQGEKVVEALHVHTNKLPNIRCANISHDRGGFSMRLRQFFKVGMTIFKEKHYRHNEENKKDHNKWVHLGPVY
ncbi:hypothetical protein, partial [Peribacillus simplex]|uniref:hypothetical protein n=1 Tax=Peribacillus simplex TaxID=1478 RepID=UPI003CEBA3F3